MAKVEQETNDFAASKVAEDCDIQNIIWSEDEESLSESPSNEFL